MPVIIPIVVFSVMFAITGMIGSSIMKTWRGYWHNLKRSRETTSARVVDKRHAVKISRSVRSAVGGNHRHVYYYVTFEFRNGHRREFIVDADKYSVLMAGDKGDLVYQGAWFLSFTRGRQTIASAPQKGALVGLLLISAFMLFFIVFAVFMFSKFLEFRRFGF